MTEPHVCYQANEIKALKEAVSIQNRALFGDPTTGNVGAVYHIKEINDNIKKMMPTYQDMDNWGNFFKKGRELGALLVAIALGGGVLIGAALAIKEWIKK